MIVIKVSNSERIKFKKGLKSYHPEINTIQIYETSTHLPMGNRDEDGLKLFYKLR